jgi:type IV secretion system protein VirB4
MTTIRAIVKEHREAGALSALLNLVGFVDDAVFLTKSGDLGLVLVIGGLDDECLDIAQREQVAQQFAHALRLFDERFRLYQYVLKRRLTSMPHQAVPTMPDEASARRAAFLNTRGLFTIDVRFVILFEPPRAGRHWASGLRRLLRATPGRLLSESRTAGAIDLELTAHAAHVRAQARAFCDQVADVLRPHIAVGRDAYAFIRRLLNYNPIKSDAVLRVPDAFLDFYAADSALECHRGYLRLDDDVVRVLTLKAPPAQTYATMLRDLYALPIEFVAVSEWRREPQGPMRRAIHAKRRHFHNAKASLQNYLQATPANPDDMLIDDGASAIVADLGASLRDMEIHGHYFGAFSLTVVVYGPNVESAQRGVAACMKAFAAHDATLIDERYNLLNAWLATIPGGSDRNLRSMYVLNTNYADLSFLFSVDAGRPRNETLGAPCLAILETDQHTPYCLNLHRHDVAHSVVLGSTGSGKSFLLNFLIAHAQQYRPYTVIFDLGGGYEHVTQRLGGGYLRIGLDHRAFTINPFALAPTNEHLHFLFTFVKVLAEGADQYHLTAQDDRDLYEQIGNLYEVDRDQRRLLTLSHMLPRALGRHLHRWVAGGPYADLFDHVDDTLSTASFQCFDFTGLDKYPQLLEPLLFYILHRANATIAAQEAAATFKLFVMDEAWRFLRNGAIRNYLTEALKTWRKQNAAVMLATQSSDDLERSDVLRVVVESCAATFFLANPGCDAHVFRDIFGLNDTEIRRITTLTPRQQLLFKQGSAAKVLNLHVEPESYWLYTNTPSDNVRAQAAIATLGFEAGLASLAGATSKEVRP